MEERRVINCHWYCHCFRNEKDNQRDHPWLPAVPLISIMTIRTEASNRRVVIMTTLLFQWLNDSVCSFHRHNRYIYLNWNGWYRNNWTRHIHQVINESSKNYLWECTQQQLRCYTPKRKRRHCDEITITGCIGSYHFDNLQCGQRRKSKKLSLLCMSDMETRSRRSPHVSARRWGCYGDHLGHSQWWEGCNSTQSPIFFTLNFCYKYSNQFHHSRNYINQSSNIWYGEKQSINYAS